MAACLIRRVVSCRGGSAGWRSLWQPVAMAGIHRGLRLPLAGAEYAVPEDLARLVQRVAPMLDAAEIVIILAEQKQGEDEACAVA